MAELHQILGALLRDIAQARFSSDIYSRNISRYYEQNSLLRRFPVPRAEIEEVEIELKFSLSGVDFSGGSGEGREVQLASFFERQSNALASRFVETAAAAARSLGKDDLASELGREAFRIDLRQDMLRYLMNNYPHLIDAGGRFDADAAQEGLKPVVARALAYRMERVESVDPDLARGILGKTEIKSVLALMQKEIREFWGRGGDCRVLAEIGGAALAELPPEVISSIKIKAGLRNYNWTQIESQEEGRTWRSLSPE
ncbi:hypothetical protein SAMN05660860_02650 [Geoalkalibacter ferrihydriticus]|uniref:Uncharacterized protein n=2 Tax=Geoalkalibacter ferrihydriticus TaxID=392333 RepID=A0A0C2HGG2_9BACT|nr:hypothetical protein [Geoalkalibacter ferrihydriticus]KIH76031.1 hypothetical protein GFER_12255 [Geoalkalibacter ferrihydriticus DSM 17813]SDM48927.1 hypothetical protein SAMN05660860_02650 [Geoalkalibacter ferrihydriticus]